MTTKATRGIQRTKSVLVRKTAARCIDILSRADGAFESKGPGAIRGLTFMDARSHRPKSRPGFRPLECRSQSLSSQVLNEKIPVANNALTTQ